MVTIIHNRCAYCGGCVGVCHVGAITLNETRIDVSEDCTDCGRCVRACPMGAIMPVCTEAPEKVATPKPYSRSYDVVVVGAGPAGSTAATVAAIAGLKVLLVEKRQEIGSPVRCAEGAWGEALDAIIDPNPRWISARVCRARVSIYTDSDYETLTNEGGRAYVLERRIFDRVLAENAAIAGAEVRVKTAVTALIRDGKGICGVELRSLDPAIGEERIEVQAPVVIGADGVESRVAYWAELRSHARLRDTLVCGQYLLAGIDIDPECNQYVVDYRYAPGGYIWVFPKGDGRANVGIGIQCDRHGNERTAFAALNEYIEANPKLAKGYPVTLFSGHVPVAPVDHIVTDGLMLVGDAAGQVDPLNGAGIVNAMVAGRLAAETVTEADGDFSAVSLSGYQRRWHAVKGRSLSSHHRIRERYINTKSVDSRLLSLFARVVGG